MLSKSNVTVINSVRMVLRQLEEKCSGETRFPHGKFAEACHAADAALLNVLLIARHWFDSDLTDDDMRVTRKEK